MGSLELAKHRRIYEDIASKFFEHFMLISDATTYKAGEGEKSLWNEEDGFYYDAISYGGPWTQQLPVRSLVGLIPLYATLTLEPQLINKLPNFKKRVDWFIENRHDVAERNMASIRKRGKDNRILLSLVSKDRLEKILKRMLDEDEFFSDHGIRSLSKFHKEHPYAMDVNGQEFKVECPTGSGDMMHLGRVSEEIQHRLQHLMARGDDGRRAINDGNDMLDFDPNWKDNLWFYEFFDGDTGRGLGATHQCGWTGLLARMIHDTGLSCRLPQTPRTPSTGMNHYFDDVFTRHVMHKTEKSGRPNMRRSSTARSIAARSDFDLDDARSIGNSVEAENPERERERREADFHTANYVSEQLERVRSHQSADFEENGDEYEAQLDGQ